MADLKNEFGRLCEIVARLRAPDGCPWDREQTRQSLIPPLIEEAYEVTEAAGMADDAAFGEELGDLLLLIVMHAQIAAEEKRFSMADVAQSVIQKLVRRHPHVFGESNVRGSGAVLKQWEAIKRAEKPDGHYLASLPRALPALMRAEKAQKKAARVNFDWSDPQDVIAKIDEELLETKEAIAANNTALIAQEVGDLLFAVVNLARKWDLDAEMLLQSATNKFVDRFNDMENRLHRRGKKLGEVSLEQLDEVWEEIKAERS